MIISLALKFKNLVVELLHIYFIDMDSLVKTFIYFIIIDIVIDMNMDRIMSLIFFIVKRESYIITMKTMV
jgi:hypothetical protein